MRKSKLVIFHPTSYFGGASVLFSRIYNYAIENNVDIIYIDDDNGYTKSRNVNKKQIYSIDQNLNNLISEDDVIICTTTQIKMLKRYLSDLTENPRVMLWVVHPYEASLHFFRGNRRVLKLPFKYATSKILINSQHKKRKEIIKFINQYVGNSLFFMDAPCINATNYFLDTKLVANLDNIIPIPYQHITFTRNEKKHIKKDNSINLSYFGRVEHFKTGPLISLLNELSKIKDVNRIIFHIIGDGQDLSRIISKFSKKMTIISLGLMENEDAKAYMKENIDILFAMGTAAIDGASLGIPTVLLNASNSARKQRYDWLYKEQGFSLGDYSDAPWFCSPIKNLRHIIDEFNANSEELSIKSFIHVDKKHSIQNVVKHIIQNKDGTTLRLSELLKYNCFY
ncbi:hypothetical protein ACHCAL_21165 [Providencia huaxiensis]|uniref:hypothetical protein n=2 Tax=Providencia huaxiensis TaxID=2027290 RepID=UPI003756C57C